MRNSAPAYVKRTRLNVVERPLDVLRCLRGRRRLVALIGAWHAGEAIIGWEPAWVVRSDPIDAVSQHRPITSESRDFAGGWIGAWGYDPAGSEHLVGYYEHVLRCRDGVWWLESLDEGEGHTKRLAEVTAAMADIGLREAEPPAFRLGEFTMAPTAEGHRIAVNTALRHLAAGEIWQVNLAVRLQAAFSGDPLEVFCRGVEQLAPAYAAFISGEDRVVVSFSPELFLRRQGRDLLTSPIKGTAALNTDPADLSNSIKDRAENMVGVDLMRNDFSKVCVPGSVRAPALARIERHTVWHLVSDVTGRLKPEVDDSQLLQAVFPPGSVTGMPKRRAIELISELEAVPRMAYTGAIGHISPVEGVELNVAIRTFEIGGDSIWLGAGGAIGAESTAETELNECYVKARPLIEAIGGSLPTSTKETDTTHSDDPCGVDVPTGAPGVVFETIRVDSGRPLNLEAHLFRLDQSMRTLHGFGLPPGIRDQVTAAASIQAGSSRLKLETSVNPADPVICVTSAPFAPSDECWELVAHVIDGGMGEHKWADRRRLGTARPDSQELLLVDTDGSLLEGGRSSLFSVDEAGLHTPPLDGRILPGTMRARVIEIARSHHLPVRERHLFAADIHQAQEVFMTNALRGIIPVRAIHGLKSRDTKNQTQWNVGPVTTWLRTILTTPGLANPPIFLKPDVRVLLIDHDDASTHSLVHIVESAGGSVRVVDPADTMGFDDALQTSTGAVTHAIIASWPDRFDPQKDNLMKRLLTCQIPALGVGQGHLRIAAAFGTDIVPATQPSHGKRSQIWHDSRGIYRGLRNPTQMGQYHSHTVAETSMPTELFVTARNDDGEPTGFRHRDYPVESTQAHIESVLTDHGHDLIANFLKPSVATNHVSTRPPQ